MQQNTKVIIESHFVLLSCQSYSLGYRCLMALCCLCIGVFIHFGENIEQTYIRRAACSNVEKIRNLIAEDGAASFVCIHDDTP